MQKNKWSRKFEWIKSGNTYSQQVRSEIYDENKYIAVGDIYFKLNKYLTGITFTYVNSLNDIYKRDLITGDGYSIVNMYNEYDVIDRVLKNLTYVDVAVDTNIDINAQWLQLNSTNLLPGHLVLLKNQNNLSENDIYTVNSNYRLQNSGILSTIDKSDKFSCSVKLGNNADKQFFLINSGDTFPISFEPKNFIEGQSFLLKNLINYNLYNTATASNLTSKMIFTDYDLARTQISENYTLYYETFVSGITTITIPDSYVTIDYHHDNYTIRSGTSITEQFTGSTSDILNTRIFTFKTLNIKNLTSIPYPLKFDCVIGDYIKLNIIDSGNTSVLTLNTYIKNIIDNYIILEEVLPNWILADLKNYNFYINNLNIATDWTDVVYKLSNTPYSDFFIITSGSTIVDFINIKIDTNDNIYYKYFDYDGLTFHFNDDYIVVFFSTLNQYINYKLYDRLNQVNSGFTSGFTFFNDYLLNVNSFQYTDNNRIKILTSISGETSYFRPFTYVNVSGDGPTQKVLVYNVGDYDIIIEKPSLWSIYPPPQITSIQNIDGLQNISDILYELYMNQTFDWFVQKSDNERKYIFKIYAELLTLNDFFRSNVTGILYENENNKFILKLYDIENDQNLFFSTTEVVFVGADKKTRLPVPLSLLNPINTTTTTKTIKTTTTTVSPTTTTTTLPATTTTTTLPATTTTTTVPFYITTTTTTLSPLTTTTTTYTSSPATTTTTTTFIPTTTTTTILTTTTTTMLLPSVDVYYGISSNTRVDENIIKNNFISSSGYVGSIGGKLYTFDSGYSYKYWCIPDLPNNGDRVINYITDGSIITVIAYDSYYNWYQIDPTPTQSVTYGKIIIDGFTYRIYRTISKSSNINQYVYSF